jgi:hypothetical protein
MKLKFLLCSVFLSATLVAASPPLSFTRTEVAAGPNCCSIVAGDFNGDGRPDIAAILPTGVGGGSRDLLVLIAGRDGSFTAMPPAALGNPLTLVAAADVNADGKLDLVAVYYFTGGTFLLIGNGNGAFQPPKLIAPENTLRLADFNNDGKPDLLLSHLTVRLGNGDGTFANPIATPAAQNDTALGFITLMAIGISMVMANSTFPSIPPGTTARVLRSSGWATARARSPACRPTTRFRTSSATPLSPPAISNATASSTSRWAAAARSALGCSQVMATEPSEKMRQVICPA